ncbi:MAG: PHP-associated domain-containing protein [Promethearchaeota archaeon]
MKNFYEIEKYGAVFDAHIHTYFDFHDGRISPKDLIKFTIKKGFNWVNAMAHDTIRGVTRIKKAAKEHNLPVITSMEVSTGYNHLLAYGVQEWNYAKDCWDPEIVIERLRAQDCAIFVSHPGINPWKGYWTRAIVDRLDVDGIEWLNASNFGLNRITWKQFNDYQKGKIAGSDAHHVSQFGFAYTQVEINSNDPDDLVEALKKGKCRPLGRYVPFHRFLMWEAYVRIKRKFFPTLQIEGYWIKPNYGKMGIQPDIEFNPEKWKNSILRHT